MAITTLNKVKIVMQIADTSKDTLINTLIPLVEADVKDYCNNQFTDGFPAGIELIAIKMIAYHISDNVGLKSESIGDASVSYRDTYPESITCGLNRYRILKLY